MLNETRIGEWAYIVNKVPYNCLQISFVFGSQENSDSIYVLPEEWLLISHGRQAGRPGL